MPGVTVSYHLFAVVSCMSGLQIHYRMKEIPVCFSSARWIFVIHSIALDIMKHYFYSFCMLGTVLSQRWKDKNMSTTKLYVPRRKPSLSSLLIMTVLLLLAGCVTTSNVQQIDQLESLSGEKPTIVLMPPDIRYYLVTTSGMPQPNAEWTEAAQENFEQALLNYADDIGADVRIVDRDNNSDMGIKYDTLHSAVGLTLLQHHFGNSKLPSKAGNFDWSLGPGVSELARIHGADYALFVYYRDYQASGGRVAFSILAAAAGVGVAMGSETGFASLVDLKTGDIVWFNVVTAGKGELRNPKNAAAAVNNLFRDIPTANARTE